MKELRVKDWQNNRCPYGGCLHNHEGECMEDFSLDDIDVVEGVFECHYIYILDNHCIYCRSELVYTRDMVPYGDTSVPLVSYECLNC